MNGLLTTPDLSVGGCRTCGGEPLRPRAYGVSGLLFVRDAGTWKLAAQAWDLEREDNAIPEELREPAG